MKIVQTQPTYRAPMSGGPVGPTIEYTSASVLTTGLFDWRYGRLEVRAKVTNYTGTWPAIWTLKVNCEWPSSGEVDVMENYDGKIWQTLPGALIDAGQPNGTAHDGRSLNSAQAGPTTFTCGYLIGPRIE